mgnify:CR=1 FL=1
MAEDHPLYKAANGRFYAGSLFYEMWKGMSEGYRRHDPVFSLYEDLSFNDKPLINAKKAFIEEADPSGYKWAIKYLGSWQHWQKLCDLPWFQEALAIWREELAAKLHADALKEIVDLSRSAKNDAQRLAAAKYLVEQGWVKKNSRGRPNRSESSSRNTGGVTLDEDAERIGLRLVNGGKN